MLFASWKYRICFWTQEHIQQQDFPRAVRMFFSDEPFREIVAYERGKHAKEHFPEYVNHYNDYRPIFNSSQIG